MASDVTITKGKYLENYIHIPYKPDLLIPCVPAADSSVVNEHGSLTLVWRSGIPDGVDPDNVRSSREAPNSSHTLENWWYRMTFVVKLWVLFKHTLFPHCYREGAQKGSGNQQHTASCPGR